MTMLEIINELKRLGYNVKSRKRSDGGYLITSINGVKYRGATGNNIARQIVNAPLSQKRIEQRKFNVNKYIKSKKKPKNKLGIDLKRKLRRVQAEYRKNKIQWKITAPKIRRILETEGVESAINYIERQLRYARGYAYTENVMYLVKYMQDTAKGLESINPSASARLYSLADLILDIIDTFKETWISVIYSYLYEININPSMSDNNINKIESIIQG